MTLRLRLLGGVGIESEDGPLHGRAAHRRRLALLSLLATSPRASLSRDRLISYLWADCTAVSARHLLSESLYVLKRDLGEDSIVTAGNEIVLNLRMLTCDLVDFRQAVAENAWRRAAEFYAGAFLDGFYVDDAPEFMRWVDSERDRAGREYAIALEALATLSAREGDLVASCDWWGRLAACDPYNARVVLEFMKNLAALGDRPRAVQAAAIFTTRMRDDLELEPDSEVTAFAEALRTETRALRSPAVVPPRRFESPSLDASAGLPLAASGQLPEDLQAVRVIGNGSVSTVYLARESPLGRLVAVKLLSSPLAGDERTRLRFEREAQVAAGILHPHVAPVYRIGRTADGIPYIVYPYVGGGSLEDRLAAAGPLSVDEVRRFTSQVAAGLGAAHRIGAVHRDVRPGNVLYDRETDRVLLIDFGLAAVADAAQNGRLQLTRPGEPLGHPAYASPEQLRGEPVTERSDSYALGTLAFELLTGRLPFDSFTPAQLLIATAHAEPRLVSEFRNDVDPALNSVIQRCLNKRPEHRPFATDVVRMLEGS